MHLVAFWSPAIQRLCNICLWRSRWRNTMKLNSAHSALRVLKVPRKNSRAICLSRPLCVFLFERFPHIMRYSPCSEIWITQGNKDNVSGKTSRCWVFKCHFSNVWSALLNSIILPWKEKIQKDEQIKPELSAWRDAVRGKLCFCNLCELSVLNSPCF